MPTHTIRKVKFLSKNSILTKTPTFSQVFHPNFFWQFFSWSQSCQQLKSPKPQHFHEFFTQNNSTIFSGIQSWNLDKKWRFRTVWASWLVKKILLSKIRCYPESIQIWKSLIYLRHLILNKSWHLFSSKSFSSVFWRNVKSNKTIKFDLSQNSRKKKTCPGDPWPRFALYSTPNNLRKLLLKTLLQTRSFLTV